MQQTAEYGQRAWIMVAAKVAGLAAAASLMVLVAFSTDHASQELMAAMQSAVTPM
ncbi:MAG: hypothetical protein M3Z31_02040 [Pseudomonadota bacterium]|nr:hypothetical protein [Pseudomonadota bacterium]